MKKLFMKKVFSKKHLGIGVSVIAAVALFGTIFVATKAATTTDYSNMTIQEVWKSAGTNSLTYVFAGDSITHNSTYTQGMNSYPEWFEQYLFNVAGRDTDVVINTAWGGATTAHFLPDAERESYTGTGLSKIYQTSGNTAVVDYSGMGLDDMITDYVPDVVFIKLGMNDRGSSTVAQYKANYESILDGIYAAGKTNGTIPKVVMLSPTPMSNDSNYNEDQEGSGSCWSWRTAAKEVAESYSHDNGVFIEFVDLMDAYLNKEYVNLGDDYWFTFFSQIESDGYIHQNAAGQYLIFKTLSEKLGIYDEDKTIFQYEYDDLNSANLWSGDTSGVTYNAPSWAYGTAGQWADAFKNGIWVIAGEDYVSSYSGTSVNRSLFRLLENNSRQGRTANDADGTSRTTHQYYTNRFINAGNGYTLQELSEDATILNTHLDNKLYDDSTTDDGDEVLVLIPAVTGQITVANFKTYVKNVLLNSNADVKIVWTPLGSSNADRHTELAKYQTAVKEVQEETAGLEDVLVFDAYAFMDTNMTNNTSLKTNWFDDATHLSALGAKDVARAFFATKSMSVTELSNHDLRQTTDKRLYKEGNVRDYVSAAATADNTAGTIAVNISNIKSAYSSVEDIKIAWLPEYGAGDFNENIRILDATVSGNTYTVTTPCTNPVLTVYGTVNGITYRFKDLKVTATVKTAYKDAEQTEGTAVLNSLEVVGAESCTNSTGEYKGVITQPAAGNYNVTLHQYQREVQIRATSNSGVYISVNGQDVESGALSQLITVDSNTTITVKASGTNLGATTYTLNLQRPDYADIIITEVMQYGGSNYDLIEIYNASGRDLDLKDYSIGTNREYPNAKYGQDDSESWPYYFVGNRQTFSGTTRYTRINPITKNSSHWSGDNAVEEPDTINFPADSTMVLWVKYWGNGADYTYDTLLAHLNGLEDEIMQVDDAKIVPDKEQIIVAEFPSPFTSWVTDNYRSQYNLNEVTDNYFYLDNFGAATEGTAKYTRNWLYVLEDDAKVGTNGAITEAGNDIVSASMYVGSNATNYSTTFTYDTDRGMSVVDTLKKANSFGAIEYYQKPADLDDTTKPAVTDNTQKKVVSGTNTQISFTLTDDTDVRYMELYVKRSDAGDTEYTKITKDFVLEQSSKDSMGLATDNKTLAYTYDLDTVTDTVSYYAVVCDGNGNEILWGTINAPKTISIATDTVYYQTYENVQEQYRGTTYTYPEPKDGYLFAGWYSDSDTPLVGDFTEDTAMAKFVPEAVLGVGAQVVGSTKFATDTSRIRFISSVDSLNYQKVGFDFQLFDDVTNPKEPSRLLTNRWNNNVYKRLKGITKNADGSGTVLNYTPQMVFHNDSQYFVAYTLNNVANKYFGTGIKATPFWVTLDGTRVYGTPQTKTINMNYTPFMTNMTMEQTGTTVAYPQNGTIAQGGCTDGTNYYQAVTLSDGSVVIEKRKYDSETDTWTQVAISNNLTDVGEVSDMVYKPVAVYNETAQKYELASKLVIAHGIGDVTKVSILDPDTLEVSETKTLSYDIDKIAYSAMSKQYVVGLANGTGMVVLNEDFTDAGISFATNTETQSIGVQSITADDSYIYAVGTNANSEHAIAVYRWTGDYVGMISISGIDALVTPASISVCKNKFYVSVNTTGGYAIYSATGAEYSIDWTAMITRNGEDEYYLTLEDALVNAQENDTIIILKEEITVKEKTSIVSKNITVTNKADIETVILRGTSDSLFDNRTTGFTIKSNPEGGYLSIDGAEVSGDSIIYNNIGASVILDKVTVTGVEGSGSGAVVDNYGDMTVEDCTFTENVAAKRAPVFYLESNSTSTITGSTFSGNTATSGSGGVIYTEGEATISDSTFTNNTSYNNGGAIQCINATIEIEDCTFDGNTVTNEYGGAISVASGSVAILTGTGTFTNNKALSGGAIYTQAAVINVSGYTFENNQATTNKGGAVYVNSALPSDDLAPELVDNAFVNSTFTANIVGDGTTIASNNQGGAIFVNGEREVLINGCTFSSHHSHQGGALWIGANAKVDIIDSTLESNQSNASGGALYSGGAMLNLENTDFTENTAGTAGGAINATTGSSIGTTLTATDCNFTSNLAKSGTEGGGAISITGGSTVTFDGKGTFSKNETTVTDKGGGAIYTNNSKVTIGGNYTFSENAATGGKGGAIYAFTDGDAVRVIGATFTGNKATGSGNYGPSVYLRRTMYVCNSTFGDGQEVTFGDDSKAYISGKLTNAVFEHLANATRVYVGPSGIERDSTVTLQLHSNAAVGNTVLGQYDSTTVTDDDKAAELKNTAEIVSVYQTDANETTYKYVAADGTLAQGKGSTWITVGTSGCDYTSLADAISNASDGATICVMTDLTVDSKISVSKKITLVTHPYNTDGVTITRGATLTDSMFFVNINGGNLEVRGRITIDGNGSMVTGINPLIDIDDTTSVDAVRGQVTIGTNVTIQNVQADTSQSTNDSTTVRGGALRNQGGIAYIYGTFKNNHNKNGGGAICTQYNKGRMYIAGAVFENNTSDDEGGAIFATAPGGYLKLSNVTFKNNTASRNGGALRANQVTLDMYGCTFENNKAGTSGGAMDARCLLNIQDYVRDGVLISTTLFSGNEANTTGTSSYGGGAIRFENFSEQYVYTLKMVGGVFTGNKVNGTTLSGGAIYARTGEGVVLENVTFTANESEGDGGAVSLAGSIDNTITNCLFESNSSAANGGAIYTQQSLELKGATTFNGNTPLDSYLYETTDGLITAEDSVVYQ